MIEFKEQIFESKDKVITRIMREKILTGEFKNREKLPTVVELAKIFNASVNTIVKATNNLKKEGLLIAKPGKGLFRKNTKYTKTDISNITGTIQWRYNIAPRKKIKIFLEDSQDWQLEFWRNLFDDVRADNIDLHLETHTIKENSKVSEMDMYIGGFNALNKLNIPVENWITVEKLKKIGSLCFEGMNVVPEDIKFFGESFAIPIANISPCLWGASDKNLTIKSSNNILDFIEQANVLNENNIRYQIWTGGFLLANCGCDFLMPFIESGEIIDAERFHKILPDLRKLFLSKQLIWRHNLLTDNNNVFNEILSGHLDVVETPPQMRHIKPPKGVIELPYPGNDFLPISPVVCLVNKKCSYLEEATRLISWILEESNQRRLSDAFKFDSIHPMVNKLGSKKPTKINMVFPEQWTHDTIYSIFSWEFYYYLSGKEQSVNSFISTVNKKIKHCLSHENLVSAS